MNNKWDAVYLNENVSMKRLTTNTQDEVKEGGSSRQAAQPPDSTNIQSSTVTKDALEQAITELRGSDFADLTTEIIETGSYGTVYKWTSAGEVQLAVKMENHPQSLQEEIRVVTELNQLHVYRCPNICLPVPVGDLSCLLMNVFEPLVQGERNILGAEARSQRLVDFIVVLHNSLGSALDYLHSKGYMHRDVKPENILLAQGRPWNIPGKIVLTDFGAAIRMDAGFRSLDDEIQTMLQRRSYSLSMSNELFNECKRNFFLNVDIPTPATDNGIAAHASFQYGTPELSQMGGLVFRACNSDERREICKGADKAAAVLACVYLTQLLANDQTKRSHLSINDMRQEYRFSLLATGYGLTLSLNQSHNAPPLAVLIDGLHRTRLEIPGMGLATVFKEMIDSIMPLHDILQQKLPSNVMTNFYVVYFAGMYLAMIARKAIRTTPRTCIGLFIMNKVRGAYDRYSITAVNETTCTETARVDVSLNNGNEIALPYTLKLSTPGVSSIFSKLKSAMTATYVAAYQGSACVVGDEHEAKSAIAHDMDGVDQRCKLFDSGSCIIL